MKKLSRILLIVLLIGLLATVFSACSALSKFQYSAPDDVKSENESQKGQKYDEQYPAYLTFTYLTQAPSVFKHIYIDEFDISNVQYQVVYYVNKTDPITQEFYEDYITFDAPKSVTEDMLDSTSRKNLKVAGHHTIFVSTTVVNNGEETEVEGSFPLHLKNRDPLEFVTFTFNLNGGNALFGSTDNGVATISVIKGTSYSASDFFSTFNAVKSGYALSEWTGFSGSLTADGNKTFTAKWTNDIVKATFDLNLPADVAGNPSAYTSEPILPSAQNVQKNKGIIPRPNVDTFATLTGYSFVGWYTSKTGGKKWNFNESVGDKDFTLYARWENKTYSITYILMGGVFDGSSDSVGTIETNAKVSYINGLNEGDIGYDPNFVANLSTDCPFIITIEDLVYGKSYSDYYIQLEEKRNTGNVIKANASPDKLAEQLKKGDDYYYISGWYESPTYEEDTEYDATTVDGNHVLYARWELNDEIVNPVTEADKAKSEKYFSEYLYNYSNKADGSIRIDLVCDTAISTLVIPEKINGKTVSEFGAQAGMNLKSLVKLDASKATGLTSIGKQAFYNSYALKEVVGASSQISSVGEDAFKGTQWLDDLSSEGSFAVVGSVLIKCFDNENESINVDTELPELSGVTIIAGGAFKDNYVIKSVTIGGGIKQIDNGAFYNCVNLLTVVGANNVESVGETAFGNTKFIITAPTDDGSTANVDESTFIKIGKVYYKHIAPNDKNAVIPATVQYIAPRAFSTTPAVETIRFEDASQIVKVGEEAFTGMTWLSADRSEEDTSLDGLGGNGTYIENGFIVINHILVGYTKRIVNNGEQNWSVAFLPENIKVIASRAFSGYNNAKLTNIVIPGGTLERIEGEAFFGATSLTRISFTDDSEDPNLVQIFDNTFSGANGGLVNDSLKIYLYTNALNKVQSTPVWSDLYANNIEGGKSTLFKELTTENVAINAKVIPSIYIYDGVGSPDFFLNLWDNAGILDSAKQNIVNGIIIRRSDQVQSIENLPVTAFGNGDGYDKESRIVGDDHKFSVVYAGKTAKLNYTIYAAIKGDTIELYKDGEKIDGSNPLIFYNTQRVMDMTGLELRFQYNANVDGSPNGKIVLDADEDIYNDITVSFSGYSVSIDDNKTLNVSINYYGLLTYNKAFVYSTKKPADATIEQATALTIALDAIPTSYINNMQILITREDGAQRYESLSGRNFTIISYEDYVNRATNGAKAGAYTLDTSSVGFKYAGVRYGDNTSSFLYCELVYSVILSADVNQFSYEIISAEDKTAAIKGLNPGYDASVTIPVTVSLNSRGVVSNVESEVYTIVSIAKDAFKNKTTLKYVYIPTTVTTIGEDAFSGCIELVNVYSFAIQDGRAKLTESNVTLPTVPAGAEGVINCEVMIKDNLITSGDTVVIPSVVEIEKGDVIFRCTVTALSKKAFDKVYQNGCRTIYLPSSLKNIDGTLNDMFAGHAGDIEIMVYDCNESAVFYPVERFSSNIVKIGDRAFYGCKSLENLDLSQATALAEIGSFAFYGCSNMTEIDLSATSVTDISASMFADCTALETVTLATGTTIIENNAFYDCLALETVNNASSVWIIGNQAFHACANFTGITLPVAIVGQSAFEGCENAVINISAILVTNENSITDELSAYTQATGSQNAKVMVGGKQVTINGVGLVYKTSDKTSFNYEGAQTEYYVYYLA